MAKDRVERDEEDLVRLYLTDIGQYTLLTKDDEVRLAKAIEAGKAATASLEAGTDLTPAKKRELKRAQREGEEAERRSQHRRIGRRSPDRVASRHLLRLAAEHGRHEKRAGEHGCRMNAYRQCKKKSG